MKEAISGATEEGGPWAWTGLVAGGILGYVLAFTGGGPWNDEIIALGILLVGICAVSGAYFGAAAKLVVDHLNGREPPPEGG